MSIFLALNEHNYAQAFEVGLARCEASQQAGHKHAYASDHLTTREIVAYNAQAVAAEMAVADWLGLGDRIWRPHVNTFKREPDVPPYWEVKHSRYEAAQFMPIHDNDRDTDMAIFVRGFPILEIVGYLPVFECKKPDYKSNAFGRGWFYKVPISELYPIKPIATAINEFDEVEMLDEKDVIMRCVSCGCWIMAPLTMCKTCTSWRLPQ